MTDMRDKELMMLANRLRKLHLHLGEEKNLNADRNLARSLEDQIGSLWNVSDDAVSRAQALLREYPGF